MAKEGPLSEDGAGAGSSGVAFHCREIPNSYFYELSVRLGDQDDIIGGSRVFVSPEDELMRAALVLIAGGWEADARFPAENDDHTLSFRMFNWQDGVSRRRLERPCKLTWSEVDPRSWPAETRLLGIAASTLQLAEAIFAFGQAYYAEREPSAALIALGAALPAIKSADPFY